MKRQTLNLVGTTCTLTEEDDVLISRRRVRSAFVVALGLSFALGGLGLFILSLTSDPVEGCFLAGGGLGIGGVLSYVGVRAFTAPEISMDAADRLIHVHERGSKSAQTRPFDAVVGVDNVASEWFDIRLFCIRLRFEDDKPLSLLTTGSRKKAQEIVRWLEAAFAPKGMPSDCPACGAWNAPGSEYCGECGAPLEVARG